MPSTMTPTMAPVQSKSPTVVGVRLVTSRTWKLWYNGSDGSVFGLISFLHRPFTIFQRSPQTLRIQRLQPRRGAHLLAAACVLLSEPAHAQKLGVGGNAADPLLQDRASGEIRVLIELDHRTHNASEDRDRDRITAADG